MKWENLTSPQFAGAVGECEGVCLLPLGVIEKHGDHLPLGTDLFIARELALRAAELEPAIVFPPYFLTQIYEARHTPGTIGIESGVMVSLLQTVCDEIGRNGLNKIILVNGHGGNRHFLPHLITLQLERRRDYVLYMPREDAWLADEAFIQGWTAMAECKIRDEHGGEMETSMVLALHPERVDMDALTLDQGLALDRLKVLEDARIYNAMQWYASFPHHYSGQAEYGTAAKGEYLLGHVVTELARMIRLVKDDDVSRPLQDEFFDRLG